MDEILHGDALEVLDKFEPESVDLCATDAPYGLRFMAKHWDVDVPSVELWKKVLRVLKPGALFFNLSSPRQDVLARNIMRINEAGFDTNFPSIYWTYAQGFPKGSNVSKLVDQGLGLERKISSYKNPYLDGKKRKEFGVRAGSPTYSLGISGKLHETVDGKIPVSEPASPEAKSLDGSFAGFQPKPAVEVVIVAMKPLENLISRAEVHALTKADFWYSERSTVSKENLEKLQKRWERTLQIGDKIETRLALRKELQDQTWLNRTILLSTKPFSESNLASFVTQALKNRKGITWLEDGRIPYSDTQDKELAKPFGQPTSKIGGHLGLPNVEGLPRQEFDFENWGKGRYAPNLLVSDDVLAIETGTGHSPAARNVGFFGFPFKDSAQDSEAFFGPGHFSRYFDLDAWFRKKLDSLPSDVRKTFPFLVVSKASSSEKNEGLEGQPLGEAPETARSKPAPGRQSALGNPRENFHPTVKPVALMSYLITIGSRENDVVLDPLCGSGSTLIAARLLARRFYGIDKDADSVRIARGRLQEHLAQERLENWFE